MPRSNLNERYQKILKATVKHYIATAEPVGSKTLLEGYNFRVSSATIRNVLGHLEKDGLLYQPHTSSGRVPSDSGYRIYVDELMIPDETVGKQVEQHLIHQFKRESWSFESLLQRATQILANISGYIAIITMPQTSTNKLKHLQLIQVSSRQVMLLIVTDGYQTQSVLMDTPKAISDEETEDLEEALQILSNFLNQQLKGYTFAELVNLDWSSIDREFVHYKKFLKNLVQEIGKRLQAYQTPSIIMHGVSEVLRQPEFSQLQQVQMLLHLLEEEQEQLLPLICVSSDDNLAKKVNIKIGSENPLESMRLCALVSAVYRQGEYPVGSVGIIGPTRMLYENTIPLVETTADYLTEALSDSRDE